MTKFASTDIAKTAFFYYGKQDIERDAGAISKPLFQS